MIKALLDRAAWLLIVPVLVVLAVIDLAMVRTMVEWSLFAAVLAGFAIIISRVVFPQIKLGDLVNEARAGSAGAGLVAAGLLIFFGLLLLALAGWTKP